MSVELPKDAEGREVPLDTKTLYDEYGRPIKVTAFQYSPEFKKWLMHGWFNAAEMSSRVSKCYLTAPDSWEKLLEDIERIGTDDCTWFCGYANENGSTINDACLDSCKFFKGDEIPCRKKLADDIVSRIRKLRG